MKTAIEGHGLAGVKGGWDLQQHTDQLTRSVINHVKQ